MAANALTRRLFCRQRQQAMASCYFSTHSSHGAPLVSLRKPSSSGMIKPGWRSRSSAERNEAENDDSPRDLSPRGADDDDDDDGGKIEEEDRPQEKRVERRELGDGITNVVLSRPQKLNGLDMRMFESIAETAAGLRDDRAVRAVILSGEGEAFCTGLDVKSMMTGGNPKKNMTRLLNRPSGYGRSENVDDAASLDDAAAAAIGNLAQDVGYLWRDIPAPVIAVLHGMCFGGGMQIALGADLRFSTPDCRLSIMEAKWGLIPDMSASVTLRELVRIDVAKELTMTGRVISGTEAAELGLVTRCSDDPMAEAVKVAREIVSRSPDSVAATKKLYQKTWVADEEQCLKVETELQTRLIASWNQVAASGRNFGLKLPYIRRKKSD